MTFIVITVYKIPEVNCLENTKYFCGTQSDCYNAHSYRAVNLASVWYIYVPQLGIEVWKEETLQKWGKRQDEGTCRQEVINPNTRLLHTPHLWVTLLNKYIRYNFGQNATFIVKSRLTIFTHKFFLSEVCQEHLNDFVLKFIPIGNPKRFNEFSLKEWVVKVTIGVSWN